MHQGSERTAKVTNRLALFWCYLRDAANVNVCPIDIHIAVVGLHRGQRPSMRNRTGMQLLFIYFLAKLRAYTPMLLLALYSPIGYVVSS